MKKVGIQINNTNDYFSYSLSNDKTKIVCYHTYKGYGCWKGCHI